jgi:hypothetical protein
LADNCTDRPFYIGGDRDVCDRGRGTHNNDTCCGTYVLFSVYSGRDADWSKSKMKYSPGEEEKYNTMTEFLAHPEYETIFEDDYFLIYRKKK